MLGLFGRYGFTTVDLDRHVHEVLQGNERVKLNLRGRFGEDCIDANSGKVLTERVAELVFQDGKSLTFLENLVYPEIEDLWQRETDGPSVVEIPLLFENNLEMHFNHTVCVYANYPEQLSRAIVCRNWSREELDLRVDQQLPLVEKIRRADFVIGNNGSIFQLERQVQWLLEKSLR